MKLRVRRVLVVFVAATSRRTSAPSRRSIGLKIPQAFLARADVVIQ
jgi:hypothetical protein